jgi:Tol biopolymer transport system component
MASDLVVFDTETNTVFTDSLMCSENSFETFPEWSPDGKYLYFCSAPARPMPDEYESLRYDLLRISFDISTRRFGNRVDTLVSSTRSKKSVALPRVSPDNKYIVFCMSNFGTFPIWHRENDLYLMNLETAKITNLTTINSNQSDSYHSWSANGRWLAFGSRRMDGTYTRPYICYFDTEGHAYTPFLLPQKIPEHYDFLTKSYNIPEFITGKVSVSPNEFTKAAKGKTVEVVFNSH